MREGKGCVEGEGEGCVEGDSEGGGGMCGGRGGGVCERRRGVRLSWELPPWKEVSLSLTVKK